MTITDEEIQDLIHTPKAIVGRAPRSGYKEEKGHRRCDLDVEATSLDSVKFIVFIRQNRRFIENFSIGLRYRLDRLDSRTAFTLVRYNGPHGEISRHPDGHHAWLHIHRITAREIASGSIQPQESRREVTDRYATFEQAIDVFFQDIRVSNYHEYFIDSLQGRLFNGHR